MISEYIETSFGKVPKDWQISKIEEIADVKGGKRLPKGESLTEVKTNHPYIRVADMYFGGVDTKNLLYVPEHVFPTIKNYIIGKDDLFISVAGTLGIVGEIPIKLDGANLTENADRLTNISINKSFLLQVLLSPIIQNAIEREQTNNAQPKLALSRIRAFEIPNPSLPEQQKIAEILSTVDDKIEVIDQQIIETQELKKGLMQRLLTKGIGHTEFKDSPLGTIPKSWEVVELDEISSTTRLAGYEYSEYWEESIDGEITALRGYNIGKNKLLLHNVIKISEELSQKLVRSRLFKGDVVFPCVGTIGNAIVIKEDNKYHINQNIAKITPDKNLDSYFLMQYLISPMCRKEIKRFNATTSQPNVLVGSLRKFRIPFPSNIEEQIKISNILGYIDEKLDVLMEKKVHYKEIKQGLMQQLLTGKIRVKV